MGREPDFRAEVAVEDGDVAGERIAAGQATVSVQDGDLRLRGCSGTWDIRTEDGDAALRDRASGAISVRTTDGDVSLQLVAGDRPDVEIESEDGNVEITASPDVSAARKVSSARASGTGGSRWRCRAAAPEEAPPDRGNRFPGRFRRPPRRLDWGGPIRGFLP